MIEEIAVPALDCLCEVCLAEWLWASDRLPKFCQNLRCRSAKWNGPKRRYRSHRQEIQLPPPRWGGRPRASVSLDDDET